MLVCALSAINRSPAPSNPGAGKQDHPRSGAEKTGEEKAADDGAVDASADNGAADDAAKPSQQDKPADNRPRPYRPPGEQAKVAQGRAPVTSTMNSGSNDQRQPADRAGGGNNG